MQAHLTDQRCQPAGTPAADVLSGSRRAEALALARRIAGRLSAAASSLTVTPDGRPSEADSGLGAGFPGIALALLQASEVLGDESLLRSGQTLLRRAAESTSGSPMTTAGLYSGTAGFAWVLAEFARHEPRYRRSLRSTATLLAEQAAGTALTEPGDGVPQNDYDVIQGAAGQLAALVRLAGMLDAQADDPVVTVAGSLIEYLLKLTGTDASGRPCWYVAPRFYPAAFPWYAECFPNGMYNLGFAHGMPGALAALCAAALAGMGGAAVRDRIDEVSGWLVEHQLTGAAGPGWPPAISAEPGTGALAFDPGQEPGRAAWCYGTPGVAAALLSAAEVLKDDRLAEVAAAGLGRVSAATPRERQAFAPTLCHGQAGLLMIYRRAYFSTGVPGFLAMAHEALRALAAAADDANAYVFADEPSSGEIVQNPGLLTGAAGVLLALCGCVSPAAARWDEIFFLAPAGRLATAGAEAAADGTAGHG